MGGTEGWKGWAAGQGGTAGVLLALYTEMLLSLTLAPKPALSQTSIKYLVRAGAKNTKGRIH